MIVRKIVVGQLLFLAATTIAHGATCESLKSLSLEHTTITLAQSVYAGEFSPPSRVGGAATIKGLPAFCRVAATLRPSADSNIKMELWMPLASWNGKFQAVGNGGWAGSISYVNRDAASNGGLGGMAGALQNGYAAASTDTGHDDPGAKFALGHPEKLIDYAYRAIHEMTVASKAIMTEFYEQVPRLSYFNGCSTGGRQALVEAQRYPEDFDGILAGAAANPKTHLDAWRVWLAQAMFKDSDSYIPDNKYSIIHQAVLEKCDALDGIKDGLIENPLQCHFDPSVLECKGVNGPQCLTKTQIAAVKTIMAPAQNRKTGTLIFPGFEPGNELGWGRMLKGPDPYDTALDDFKYVILGKPDWDWRTFDLERDTAIADKAVEGTIGSVDPNLTKFAQRGNKLLMYHGWADQDIAPQASVNYYNNTSEVTKATSDWVRLFMMPGMQHCQGGEGPNSFDPVKALEQWVEKGTAPDQIIASHRLREGTVDRTRPLCPYPRVAKYKGTGSIDEAANFVCAAQ